MASMREIKRRRGSIQSTQQITKAMKLVSTVKLQKARMRAENSKAYFEYMYQTVTSMLAKAGNIEHPYLRKSVTSILQHITIYVQQFVVFFLFFIVNFCTKKIVFCRLYYFLYISKQKRGFNPTLNGVNAPLLSYSEIHFVSVLHIIQLPRNSRDSKI